MQVHSLAGLTLATTLLAHAAAGTSQEPTPTVSVIEVGRELLLDYGPLTVPAGTARGAAVEPPAILFQLPADGWMRGYVVELSDDRGRRLPQTLLHHLNVMAKDKRDLFSDVMLRLGAAGPETSPIVLPRLLGVRARRGDTLVMTVMLHNRTATRYDGVRVRVRIPFVRSTSRIGALAVYPMSVAIGPKYQTNTFDLPPGRSEHYWEGSPAVPARILGLSGHLHRYGVALRLEDRTTGDILWEIRPESDSDGEVRAMPASLFLWSLGKPIRPDHVYRLTAIYDNPEGRTIPAGGMGVIGGVVRLARGHDWPVVDPDHPDYLVDVRSILGIEVNGGASTTRTGHEGHASPNLPAPPASAKP
jgi:hypothetical protein